MPMGTKNPIIKGCGLHHIAVQTRDWDASLHLYRDVLGMKIVAEFGSPKQKNVLMDAGDGSHMELLGPQVDTPSTANLSVRDPLVHIALAVADTRTALEHVREAGYEVTMEPTDLNLGGLDATIAFFKGPNGEILEFFQTNGHSSK